MLGSRYCIGVAEGCDVDCKKMERKLYGNNSRLGYDVSKLIDEILSPASLRFLLYVKADYYHISVESKTGIRYHHHHHYHSALPRLNVLHASSPIQLQMLFVLIVCAHFLGQLKQYRILPF
jgi:hypothetical protein